MPVLDIANDDVSSRKARRVLGEFQYDQHGSVVQARVPMMLRDSADANRREVQAAIKADRQRDVVDAAGGTAGLHRPGPRFASDASARDAAEQAYTQMVADSSDAWRRGPGGHQDASALGTEYVGGQPGSPCTVRAGSAEGYLEGSPGHLARIGGELMCVPDQQTPRRADSVSATDAEAIKEAAYRHRVADGQEAWKNSGSL